MNQFSLGYFGAGIGAGLAVIGAGLVHHGDDHGHGEHGHAAEH